MSTQLKPTLNELSLVASYIRETGHLIKGLHEDFVSLGKGSVTASHANARARVAREYIRCLEVQMIQIRVALQAEREAITKTLTGLGD